MKICPNCNNKYTDATLKFCLQDGAELIGEPTGSDSHPTVSLEETPTVISSRKPEQIAFDLSEANEQKRDNSQVTQVSTIEDKPNRSNTLIAVLLTAFAMLILFGLGGIGAYYYFNNNNSEATAKANVSGNQNENSSQNTEDSSNKIVDPKTPTPEKNVKPKPEETIKPTPSPEPDINPEETKKAVSDTIYQWKSLAESRNLSAYMNNYASKLDYYNKKNASKSFVQNDKKKAFNKYDSIKATLSNMSINPSVDGKTAVAIFDKEWVFKSTDSENSGKVQTQLKLKKDDEKWLITSEKDLKIYYVNK